MRLKNVKNVIKVYPELAKWYLEAEEVKFVEKTEDNKEVESKKEEKQKRKIKDTQTRSPLEFVKDKEIRF